MRKEFPREGMIRPRWLIPLTAAFVVAMLGIWLNGMISGPGLEPGPEDYVVVSVLCGVSVAVALRACRWAVQVSETGVVVIGFFSERSLRWSEISHCAADDRGMSIYSRQGDVVTSPAFGLPKWRYMGINRLSTGENLALYLMERASEVPEDDRR